MRHKITEHDVMETLKYEIQIATEVNQEESKKLTFIPLFRIYRLYRNKLMFGEYSDERDAVREYNQL